MKLSRRWRPYLKCFLTVVTACFTAVMLVSNASSVMRTIHEAATWIPHVPQTLGRGPTLAVCLGICVVAALAISTHIHFRNDVPGPDNWLLGSGILSVLLALLLAFFASRPRPDHGYHQPQPPNEGPSIRAETAQPPSSSGQNGTPKPSSGTSHGNSAPAHTEDADYTESGQPTATEATFTPTTEPTEASEQANTSENEESNTGESSTETEATPTSPTPETPTAPSTVTATSASTSSSESTTSTSTAYASVDATTSSSYSASNESSQYTSEETSETEGECEE
jgi:hypothetical protein